MSLFDNIKRMDSGAFVDTLCIGYAIGTVSTLIIIFVANWIWRMGL